VSSLSKKKQVKFEFKATITADQFNTLKPNMTAQMANLLDVRQDYVNLNLRKAKNLTAQIRRNLNEGVDIEVTVKAADETEATAIRNKVQQEEFKTDLADSLTRMTGSEVTVATVSTPTTADINVTADDSEESNSNTVIIVVVVLLVLAVLGAAGGFAYYQYYLSDGGFFDHKGGVQMPGDVEDTTPAAGDDLGAAPESLNL